MRAAQERRRLKLSIIIPVYTEERHLLSGHAGFPFWLTLANRLLTTDS